MEAHLRVIIHGHLCGASSCPSIQLLALSLGPLLSLGLMSIENEFHGDHKASISFLDTKCSRSRRSVTSCHFR